MASTTARFRIPDAATGDGAAIVPLERMGQRDVRLAPAAQPGGRRREGKMVDGEDEDVLRAAELAFDEGFDFFYSGQSDKALASFREAYGWSRTGRR